MPKTTIADHVEETTEMETSSQAAISSGSSTAAPSNWSTQAVPMPSNIDNAKIIKPGNWTPLNLAYSDLSDLVAWTLPQFELIDGEAPVSHNVTNAWYQIAYQAVKYNFTMEIYYSLSSTSVYKNNLAFIIDIAELFII